MSWWSRLGTVVRAARLERELEEEQRFHIEARVEELVARGLAREAAETLAARRFGPRLQLREASRDARLLTWLDSLWRDLQVGIRLLRKDAIVAGSAVVSLGLAIGACTAAFSLIDALILRELPVREPHRLVHLDAAGRPERADPVFSHPFFERVRSAGAGRMEAFAMSQQSLRQAILPDAGGIEEKVRTQYVSGNTFGALGVGAARGRLLAPSDDLTPGRHPTVVISHAFWTRRMAADPRAVGQWLRVEGLPYQIVGVAQAGFTGAQPGLLTDVWLPAMMFAANVPDSPLNSPTWHWLQIWGRLEPGVSRDALVPVVRTAMARFERDLQPAGTGKARGQASAEAALEVRDASGGISQVRQMFERPLLVLALIVAVVLLIACSNVANLLLARGAARTREMALRASIGAGRGRLLQQVLVEAGVLTFAATIVGLACARAFGPLLVGMLTTNENPVYLDLRIDWRVLAFVGGLGGLTTVLFGLVPAMRASAANPSEAATLGGRHTSRSGVARPLVAAQIGFSLAILFVAGLLLRSFDRLLAVDLGFSPERLTLLSVETREQMEPDRASALATALLERVRQIPGVESASASGWALFRGWSWGNSLEVPGRGRAQTARLDVSPQFFRTMGTRVIDGRELEPRDLTALDPMPIVVNRAFVRRYLEGLRPVGLRTSNESRGRVQTQEIVGVVEDARDGSVREPVGPFIYAPMSEASGTLQLRSALAPNTLADLVRRELPRVHPSLRLVDVTTQDALVRNRLLRERLLAVLSGFFAVLGLVLAAVGLYGVSSYAVVRRTREIGIRMTLGARTTSVIRSVLGRVALAVAVGITAGLGGGIYLAGFVRGLLFEVEPVSVASVGLPAVVLAVTAVLAAWAPARRATRVDPARALRSE